MSDSVNEYSKYLRLKGGWNSISHTITKEELNLVLGNHIRQKAQAAGAIPYNTQVNVDTIDIDSSSDLVYIDIDVVALGSMN